MRLSDLWIIGLIIAVLVSCYSADHSSIPDKFDQVPELKASPVEEIKISACEIENEFLRLEADAWRSKYINSECDCHDSMSDF